MGVKGLWSLLNPVARPVQIESMEGKRLAIDSSIWLYQFQATMRDKDGRVLVNAHVLGFLRRINKLLFHGIKPVFVFDGGAPVLKRATIAERKRKRQGAEVNHARTAEKLFAAQMRREAVKAAQVQRDQAAARQAAASSMNLTNYDDEEGDQIGADAMYLDDLENAQPGPSRPRPPPTPRTSTDNASTVPVPSAEPLDPAEERRKKFRKHDPYRLPETSMPTVSTDEKPDARLATEDELKQFIDDMKPSDIDIESAEFRALPTEVQYEIIGDLRIRSRQQSHQRLATMLRGAPTALDFSMQQIKHLSQRNALTQQLLTVTDMVGKAHLTIPIRIAAERNREYVLLKRGEDVGGGWALGIREGTKQKPIAVVESDGESSSSSDEDSDDVVEVKKPVVDPDLAEHRRRQVLDAITARYASARASPRKSLDVPVVPFGASHAPSQPQLFDDPDIFADMDTDADADVVVPTANDEALALALQQEELGSDEEEADPDLARALALSRRDREEGASAGGSGSIRGNGSEEDGDVSDDSMEEVELVPSERSTPALVNAPQSAEEEDDDDDFEVVSTSAVAPPAKAAPIRQSEPAEVSTSLDNGSRRIPDEAQEQPHAGPFRSVRPSPVPAKSISSGRPIALSPEVIEIDDEAEDDDDAPIFAGMSASPAPRSGSGRSRAIGSERPPDDSGARFTVTTAPAEKSRSNSSFNTGPRPTPGPSRSSSRLNLPNIPSPLSRSPSFVPTRQDSSDSVIPDRLFRAGPSPPPPAVHLGLVAPEPERLIDEALAGVSGVWRTGSKTPSTHEEAGDDEEEEEEEDGERPKGSRGEDAEEDGEDPDESGSIAWSRSPSPALRTTKAKRPPLQTGASVDTIPSEVEEEDVDMNAEDMVEEQDDYARFIAQIKNRDLNEVRTEIDDEIRVLHGQNKVAQRDSDEITMPMIAQIQTLLRHFGIPYITAPMEAEAQCAKLAELGLVDGIITDDSDVFLFGGTQCFKNIFNDNKYAECFLASDITRELSLSRERLISLAYLLGSDYTIGLPGVGPVVALELLANFPGERGIEEFKEWWSKVQKGQDGEETDTKWKSSFKKRHTGGIFITAEWPNPLVREAYKYPVVDESEEAFHWGFPKLSALRSFLHEELSWSISKVDDELTPIVQRIARRGKAGSLNKQSTLDPFFDLSAGALANYAPRRRTTANVSKRLLSVIKQFREAEARAQGMEEGVEWGAMMQGLDETDPKGRGTGKKRSVRASEAGDGLEEDGEEDGEGEDEVRPPPKKRKPRKAKSVTTVDDGDTEYGTPEPVKKPSRAKGKKKAAVPPLSEFGDGDEGVELMGITDISQVPVEERKKWKKAQSKTWRRAVVANSLKPN